LLNQLPKPYRLSQEVQQAQGLRMPLLAFESAVITHGLPQPNNYTIARDIEKIARANGAVPATIALLDGEIAVGLSQSQLESLANRKDTRKISLRDFGIGLAGGLSGGTTVAATLFVAGMAGIRVFATGGIGGVHRNAPLDVSADLQQLGKTRAVVVCAGAKAILDLPATREVLETQGVSVIGYQTDAFPAFYTPDSGLGVDVRAENPQDVAEIALQTWEAGLEKAVLLVVPPPAEAALPSGEMEAAIEKALAEADAAGVHGAATTPYLLDRVSALTGGESLRANLALLRNNARVAARVATALQGLTDLRVF
jgi:pseudouridine-5'-phosphate glycosidase